MTNAPFLVGFFPWGSCGLIFFLFLETIIQTVNHSLVESFTSSSNSTLPPVAFHTPPEGEHGPRRSSMPQQVLQEAVKQALPMKTKDNLAEALRQIEPIAREKDNGERVLTKEEVISSIREKSLKKVEDSATEQKVEAFVATSKVEYATNDFPKAPREKSPPAAVLDDDSDSEIDEMKATFKESIKSLSGLCQEEHKTSRERVTFRQKSRHSKVAHHTDR